MLASIFNIISLMGVSYLLSYDYKKNLFNNNLPVKNVIITEYSKENSCNGLVLSGGGSFGAYQNGVVSRLLHSNKKYWDVYSGVSSGSINAVYLSQFSNNENDINDIFDNIIEMEHLWSSFKNNQLYNDEFFLNGLSLYNTKPLINTLKQNFNNLIIKNKLFISSTNVNQAKKIIWDENMVQKNMINSIMASTALPFILNPIVIKGEYHVDGGLSSNILLEEVIDYCSKISKNINIDVVLSSPFTEKNNKLRKHNTIIEYYYNLYNTITTVLMYNQLQNLENYLDILKISKKNINITIYERNGLDEFNHIDFEKGNILWNKGFNLENTKITKYL